MLALTPIKPSFISPLLNLPSLKWTRPSNRRIGQATSNLSGDMGVGNYSLNEVIASSCFTQNNRWIIAQIVLIWS